MASRVWNYADSVWHNKKYLNMKVKRENDKMEVIIKRHSQPCKGESLLSK